jgi:homoserine dehydrogenase
LTTDDSDLEGYSSNWNLNVYLRYEDNNLIEKLDFKSISERYEADNFKYVIGTINLSNLIKHKDLLNQEGVFIAEKD